MLLTKTNAKTVFFHDFVSILPYYIYNMATTKKKSWKNTGFCFFLVKNQKIKDGSGLS